MVFTNDFQVLAQQVKILKRLTDGYVDGKEVAVLERSYDNYGNPVQQITALSIADKILAHRIMKELEIEKPTPKQTREAGR